jgi:hypothetical protein
MAEDCAIVFWLSVHLLVAIWVDLALALLLKSVALSVVTQASLC